MSTDITLLAAGAGLVILAPEDIAALPDDDRLVYLARLRAFCLDHDMRRHGPYEDWLSFADRCSFVTSTGNLCTRKKWDGSTHCINHLDLTEVDPVGYIQSQSMVARIRMAGLLGTAVDRLTEILEMPNDELPPAVRLRAIDTLFDRAGVPKLTTSTLEARVEVSDGVEATTVISQRLDALAASFPVTGDVVDGVIVDDDDD